MTKDEIIQVIYSLEKIKTELANQKGMSDGTFRDLNALERFSTISRAIEIVEETYCKEK